MSDSEMIQLPPRYEPQCEIARGGMGVVWRVKDSTFDRLLAVKVMLSTIAENADAVARFEREAQLTGMLQHPAIPPVMDRGRLENGSPFYSMKLIEGVTLSALLKERKSPSEDLTRFLGVFEQVCLAVGYAHSQHIIHRDLKPANVMVGEFGEVQVMDWGLAKIAAASRTLEYESAITPRLDETDFNPESATVTFGVEDSQLTGDTEENVETNTLTVGGIVMGTLAYMPPEQARGDVGILDARADVFALGGILCKILIGRAPFEGGDQGRMFRQALAGDLNEVESLLGESGADQELIDLTRRCLSKEPNERPGNALQLAQVIQEYQETTRLRLEEARTERVAAEARAAEEKKRRRVSLIAAALAVSLLLGTGLGITWYLLDAAEKEKKENAEKARIEREELIAENRATEALRDIEAALEQAPILRSQNQFRAAIALLVQAENRLNLVPDPGGLIERLKKTRRDTEMASLLDHLRLERGSGVVDSEGQDNFFSRGPEGKYAKAFLDYGLDILNENPSILSLKINTSAIKLELLNALDDWSLREPNELAMKILSVARKGKGDPLRDLICNPGLLMRPSTEELGKLVDQVNHKSLPPTLAMLLANRLSRVNELKQARKLLFNMSFYRPDDFWIHQTLGGKVFLKDSPEECLAHCRTAVALRPNAAGIWVDLGNRHYELEEFDEATQAYLVGIKLDPNSTSANYNLGRLYAYTGRLDEAEALFQKAAKSDPDNAIIYHAVGKCYYDREDYRQAEDWFRLALKSDSGYVEARGGLSKCLLQRRQFKEAEQELRNAIKLDPTSKDLQYDLGMLLKRSKRSAEAIRQFQSLIEQNPEQAMAWFQLGYLHFQDERLDEAENEFLRAVELDPNIWEAQINLAGVWYRQQRLEEAGDRFALAVELTPKDAERHDYLGKMLLKLKRHAEAEKALRIAIEHNPQDSASLRNLGISFYQRKQFQELIPLVEQLLKLTPDDPRDHLRLGIAYFETGKLSEANARFEDAAKVAVPGSPEEANAKALANRTRKKLNERKDSPNDRRP